MIFNATALLNISKDLNASEPGGQPQWFAYLHHDGIAAIPYPFRTILYRGQNKRHLPFLPSIGRGLALPSGKLFEMPIQSQAQLTLRLAQSWWFIQELDMHPLTTYARANKIHLNGMALAQHYEIPTGYLDLTHEFDVAAFFATCRRTETGWEPMTDGIGVVYRVDFASVNNALEMFNALGPQPLPRPAEQRAWVVELPLLPSFDGWPFVKPMEFHHDEAVSRHFLEKFDDGQALFPPDPLAKVANEILIAGEVPVELIDKALDSFSEDELGIRKEDRSAVRKAISDSISFCPYRHLLTEEDLKPFLTDFETRKHRLAATRATTRPVRFEPVNEDLEK